MEIIKESSDSKDLNRKDPNKDQLPYNPTGDFIEADAKQQTAYLIKNWGEIFTDTPPYFGKIENVERRGPSQVYTNTFKDVLPEKYGK